MKITIAVVAAMATSASAFVPANMVSTTRTKLHLYPKADSESNKFPTCAAFSHSNQFGSRDIKLG